jgi:hypothetical protein
MALPDLRAQIRPARAAHEQALRHLQDVTTQLADLQRALNQAAQNDKPGIQQQIDSVEAADLPAAHAAADLTAAALETARVAYGTAAAAEPALFATDASAPVLLLPIRLEAVYRPGPPQQLWIRAYPDDIHVDSHEPELTAAERAAGEAYWRDVWAAGSGDAGAPRRDEAWRRLTSAAGRARAPWVAAQLRPAGSPPPDPTPPDQAPPDPGQFPDRPARASAWTRAAHTMLLPDKLVFSGYRGGSLVWRVEGGPIPDVLPVSFAPPGSDLKPDRDLPWDDASRWLIDFGTAVASGMGVKVTLPDEDPSFDVVTAVGVMANLSADDAAARVTAVLAAHRYTDGLELLLAGTPTNNTPDTRSAWRLVADPTPPQVDDARRAAYDAASTQPSARLARGLGLDGHDLLSVLDGGLQDDEDTIVALQSLLGTILSWSDDWSPPDDNTGLLRTGLTFLADHFTAFVRSRGPFPVVRVGRQPYGVLPASSLDLWRGTDVNPGIVAVLESFLTYIEEHLQAAVRIGLGQDQDAVLLDILSRRPSSAAVDLLSAGGGKSPPSLVGAVPANLRFGQRGPSVDHHKLVVSDPAPAQLSALAAQRPIQQFAQLVSDLQAFLDAVDWTKGTPPDTAMQPFNTRFQALNQAVSPLMDADAVGVFYPMFAPIAEIAFICGFLLNQAIHDPANTDVRTRQLRLGRDRLQQSLQAAGALEAQASEGFGRLERLVCETLDTTVHRLDAWLTSMATARLARMRAAAPSGVHVGAFGWLTDLAPADPAARKKLDGYIVAPSLHHATTAAVLRSGYLAHSDKSALAVNLTSRRVRRAVALLEGVQSDQSLSALLGYQFERGLHDALLDKYIAPFRTRYPLAPQVQAAADGADPARAAVAARNVVDGEALRLDRVRFDGVPVDGGGLPVDVGTDLTTIQHLLADLDDSVDALGDLLLAESVHHLVGGNPLRAGATVDGLAGGDWLPPELEVIRTPRSVALLSFAVGALVPPDGTSGWTGGRPISALEPGLERLAQTWLGAADSWSFALQSGDSVTLQDAGISAVEALLTAFAPADPASSPLLRGVLRSRPGAVLAPEGASRYDELAALAGRWREVLAAATPLLPSHIVPGSDAWGAIDAAELAGRAGAWTDAVAAARDQLRAARTALVADPAATSALVAGLDALAACGVRGSVCAGDPADDRARQALIAQGDGVLDLLVANPPEPVPPVPADAVALQSWFAGLAGVVTSLCGDAVRLLPQVTLGAAAAALDAANRPAATPDDTVADWLREVGRVRPGAAAFTESLLASELLADSGVPPWQLGQAPVAAERPWIALRRFDDDTPRSAGASCCVLAGDVTGGTGAGLVADAWTEALPRAGSPPREVAGVAFHVDRPDARAPQAALLAVPPDADRGWRDEDLHAVVLDTLELAQVRTLDLTDLPDLRVIIPATWFTS